MKRMLIALVLAGFAAAAFAQAPTSSSPGNNPWAQDHNFVSPPL